MDDKRIIEAALFSAGRPLSIQELRDATGIDESIVRNSLKALIDEYKTKDISIEVGKVGDKYAMQLKTVYAEHAQKLAQMEIPMKLLKTLALIAYHQPMKQSDLFDMLGPKIYDHVGELAQLGLIRAKESGRTKMITTTDRFPEYFGIETTDKKRIKKWLAEKAGIDVDQLEGTIESFEKKKAEEAAAAATTGAVAPDANKETE